ncbi:hypothetical protein D3C78_1054510 [compost metagenome]
MSAHKEVELAEEHGVVVVNRWIFRQLAQRSHIQRTLPTLQHGVETHLDQRLFRGAHALEYHRTAGLELHAPHGIEGGDGNEGAVDGLSAHHPVLAEADIGPPPLVGLDMVDPLPLKCIDVALAVFIHPGTVGNGNAAECRVIVGEADLDFIERPAVDHRMGGGPAVELQGLRVLHATRGNIHRRLNAHQAAADVHQHAALLNPEAGVSAVDNPDFQAGRAGLRHQASHRRISQHRAVPGLLERLRRRHFKLSGIHGEHGRHGVKMLKDSGVAGLHQRGNRRIAGHTGLNGLLEVFAQQHYWSASDRL